MALGGLNISISGMTMLMINPQEAFVENAFSVLNFAYKHGIRYFDTAPSYGKGEEF
jgi:aryl-alcohol dehydrogenase-like predicted oxidoreductase